MPDPNKRCKQCGAFLDVEAQFCEDCGQPVAEAIISQPQPPPFQAVPLPLVNPQYAPPPPLPQTNYSTEPAPKKSRNTCLIVGLVVLFGGLCLSVLAVGGYFIYKKINSPASVSITPTTNPVLPPSNVLPTADATPTSAETGIPDCPGAPPSRLRKGDHAQVVNVGGYSLIFYDQPRSNANEVGAVPEGAGVIIRDGPVCAENTYWWMVEFGEGGQSGWAKETQSDGTYLLEAAP